MDVTDEYGAGDPHVVVEVRAKTLGDREHPSA
jgi:hypothetical protein